MACSYGEVAAGTDLAPGFRGLPDDACPVPLRRDVDRDAIWTGAVAAAASRRWSPEEQP
jgi:hypothetical protein